jgi:hypothetical protein
MKLGGQEWVKPFCNFTTVLSKTKGSIPSSETDGQVTQRDLLDTSSSMAAISIGDPRV